MLVSLGLDQNIEDFAFGVDGSPKVDHLRTRVASRTSGRHMPLTDVKIRSARAIAGKTPKLSDGGGLQVWVTSSGSKLWHLAYRFGGVAIQTCVGDEVGAGYGSC